jgi:ribosomal protein L2
MFYLCLAVLALVSTALAVMGCGGSSSTGSTQTNLVTTKSVAAQPATTEPVQTGSSRHLTRAELILKADAICKRINARLSSTEVDNPQDIARMLPPLAAFERGALAELAKLDPPSKTVNDWRQMLAAGQTIAAGMARYGEYGKTQNLRNVGVLLTAIHLVQEKGGAIAKRNGFKDCAQWL